MPNQPVTDQTSIVQQLTDQQQQHYRWSRAEIADHQNKRLRQLMHVCRTQSPWYKKILADIDIDRFTIDDLHQLPPLDKSTLMANWDAIVTDPAVTLQKASSWLEQATSPDGRYQCWATGGTSGEKAIICWSQQDVAQYIAAVFRSTVCQIRLAGNNNPLRLATIVADNPIHMSYDLWNIPFIPGVDVLRMNIKDKVSSLVSQLVAYAPTDIVAYPSVMAGIARYCIDHSIALQPARIILTAEPVTNTAEATIQHAWPEVMISDFYGSTEIGPLAMSCHLGQCRPLFGDATIVETIDAEGKYTAALSNKIYVTNLLNYTLPLIRYEIDDQVTLSMVPCSCGSAYPLLVKVASRALPTFYYNNNSIAVSTITIDIILFDQPGILRYQVLQTTQGLHVLLQAEQAVAEDKMRNILIDYLRNRGLDNPRVDIEVCPHLPRHQDSAKSHLFVALE